MKDSFELISYKDCIVLWYDCDTEYNTLQYVSNQGYICDIKVLIDSGVEEADDKRT